VTTARPFRPFPDAPHGSLKDHRRAVSREGAPWRPADTRIFRLMQFSGAARSSVEGSSARAAEPDPDSEIVGRIRRSPCRILVVDDDDLFRASLCFKLKRIYGAVVEEASGGADALERMAREPEFQLILLDVSMPGMGGMDVCAQMRATGVDTRIVLMSAHDNPENQSRARALDVRLLGKPLPEDALRQVLLECGGGRP
jgi:CheY-like chemotaxis protein